MGEGGHRGTNKRHRRPPLVFERQRWSGLATAAKLGLASGGARALEARASGKRRRPGGGCLCIGQGSLGVRSNGGKSGARRLELEPESGTGTYRGGG
jgi:hypothetical protein